MATYAEWNEALKDYFIANVPKGSEIYLSVDTDELEATASLFLKAKIAPGKARNDFTRAIRQQCVDPVRKRVRLTSLRIQDESGVPQVVAFLAAMVLAANRMREEQSDEETSIGEGNYFVRLRDILGLQGYGRPQGMQTGKQGEESLWMLWNNWLVKKGYVPTAHAGQAGWKYINYPLSQTILRDAEKDYLDEEFRYAHSKGKINRSMDSDQICAFLWRFEFSTRRRLQQELI